MSQNTNQNENKDMYDQSKDNLIPLNKGSFPHRLLKSRIIRSKKKLFLAEVTKPEINKEKRQTEIMKDSQYWAKKIDFFFNNKFYPAIEVYRNLRQTMNKQM
jgi:hypothetical protein